ncbi:transcription antiterminator [Listeria aquatica]|uniref:Transcription antiterminator n=1 Tax=Listeria aquatica TaxID=1494960 RepID=A0A841ZJ61_9LIST|nr:PRD domain-containing protein [Listeria aquatica]MBC1520176.1 transcription antiterminator [Listeria aquatica]
MPNKERLVAYLKNVSQTRFVSARELAEVLGVTDRTIRNYVKAINTGPSPLIEANRDGYRLLLQNEQTQVIDSVEESIDSRRFYILRRMFKNTERGIDALDIADTLYVSDASIRADLAALRKLAGKYDLVIRQQQGRFILEGKSRNKRRLMVQLMRSTNHGDTGFEVDIQKFLDEIPLEEVIKIVTRTFEKFQLKPNSYFLQNFILHLAIAIGRAKEEFAKWQTNQEHVETGNVVQEINHCLAERFGIELLQEDSQELQLLCDGEFRHTDVELLEFVEPQVLKSLKRALAEIKEVYLLDFNDQAFKKRLLLHVQNLYIRSKQQKFSRNLSLLEIKVKYPVLFDMAIYLCSILSNDLKVTISDDEIAFLALHIGSFVDNQRKAETKIRAVIATPRYNSNEERIKSRIKKELGEEVIIEAVVQDLLDLDLSIQPNLIIFTQMVSEKKWDFFSQAKTVTIKEFITTKDLNLIRRKVEEIKQEKYKTFLEALLPQLIEEAFYQEVTERVNKADIFEMIAEGFLKKQFVPENFEEKLIERERLSATSFPSGVAVPHAIKYVSYRTGIFIIHSRECIEWEGVDVHLVIALSVDQDDSEDFNKIFPRMIELLAEEVNVAYLNKSENRKDFIKRLIHLMTSNGYYTE